MDCVYLDNSATTVVSPLAAEKVMELLTVKYGNPSSLHSKGLEAENEVTNARRIIADRLSCREDEIFFTSGATEANNLAVFGAAEALKRKGRRVIVSKTEHSSVIEPYMQLKKDFDVVEIDADKSGKIDLEQLEAAVNADTILISCMLVNNEIGTVQSIDKIRKIISRKKSSALLHCDAVQAFGKIPVLPNKLGADLLTVTAHKIHGPKGTGAIYIKKGVRIIPRTYGGEQEHRIRPGTESSALIAGFGAAASEIDFSNTLYIEKLSSLAKSELTKIGGITVNSPDDAIPYIINVSAEGIRSETMLHFLASNGIYVSSGSACAKGKKSHVLTALGLPPRLIDSALRISFCKYNTENDIISLCKAIEAGTQTLAKN